jgi:hypothetical protein
VHMRTFAPVDYARAMRCPAIRSAYVAMEKVGPSYLREERSIFHDPFHGLSLCPTREGESQKRRESAHAGAIPLHHGLPRRADLGGARFQGKVNV